MFIYLNFVPYISETVNECLAFIYIGAVLIHLVNFVTARSADDEIFVIKYPCIVE